MNKQKLRSEAIYRTVADYGYNEEETYLISFWELADNLNNGWYAPLFVSSKIKKDIYTNSKNWAIDHYNLWKFKRMIEWTLNRMDDVEIIIQGSNSFYRIKKDWRLNDDVMGKCFQCKKPGKFMSWAFFYDGKHRLASWCSKKHNKTIKNMLEGKWKKIYANYHCPKCAGYLDLDEKKKREGKI